MNIPIRKSGEKRSVINVFENIISLFLKQNSKGTSAKQYEYTHKTNDCHYYFKSSNVCKL